jgi:uncharacterized protein with GYD domain
MHEMPRYILLSTLTPDGRRTLHQHPHRVTEVNNEIASFGCNVIDQYALLGPYDFLTVVEAPDNETVAHLSVDIGSRGTVTLLTLPAISLPAFVAKRQETAQLGRGRGASSDDISAATSVIEGRSPHL